MIRYPGGKHKIKNIIIAKLNSILNKNPDINTYLEPCFGGGGIGIKLLSHNTQIKQIWLNDKDDAMADLWTSVIKHPEILSNFVEYFIPSVATFYSYKSLLLQHLIIDPVLKGFVKLALHQMSYSGLGTKAGGPIGGKSQQSDYDIGCRWSPQYIIKRIYAINKILKQFEILEDQCTAFDFEKLILSNKIKNCIFYIDPPYFHKGQELYEHAFTLSDHQRLMDLLKNTSHKWILSYDDCQEIRQMYHWAKIDEILIKYTITSSRTKKELLIYHET